MHIDQWFDQQRDKKLSDTQKMRIYQKHLDKSHRILSIHRISYYTKIAVFSLGLFLLGGVLYYSMQPTSQDAVILTLDNGTTITRSPQGIVQAKEIGTILSAQGNITITNKEITKNWDTKTLNENDIVSLERGGELLFTLENDVQAKIVGPARFSLETRGEEENQAYAINLIAGDYLEIVSIPTQEEILSETGTIQKDIPTEKVPQAKKPIIVESSQFSIEKATVQGTLNIIISTNDDGNKEIENKGSDIVVKKIIEDKQTFVAVSTNQTVAVDTSIELIANADTIEQDDTYIAGVIDTIKKHKLEVRYEVENLSGAFFTGSNNTGDVYSGVVATTRVLEDGEKDIVALALNNNIMTKDLAQIKEQYKNGNKAGVDIVYTNIFTKLGRTADAIGYTLPELDTENDSLTDIADTAQELATYLQQEVSIPQEQIQTLRGLALELRALDATGFTPKEKEIYIPPTQQDKEIGVLEHDTTKEQEYTETSVGASGTETIQEVSATGSGAIVTTGSIDIPIVQTGTVASDSLIEQEIVSLPQQEDSILKEDNTIEQEINEEHQSAEEDTYDSNRSRIQELLRQAEEIVAEE